MKKLLFMVFPVVLLTNCSNPELDKAKEKQKEAECRAEFSKQISDYGINTMVLGKELGLQKELDEFDKIHNDSTASCDSIKNSWERFQKLVEEKSKNIGK
jgi:hypothetical protein